MYEHVPYDCVYAPVRSEALVELRWHNAVVVLYVQPLGQLYIVPVVPVGQQQPDVSVETHSVFEVQALIASACAVGVMLIASDKPTFRFGTKWEIKNAENWD